MGKTLVYLALLGILGFGVYYFIFNNKEGLYEGVEANFTFRDTANIGKIFLVKNDGESVLLERQANNQWLLNKQYIAMPSKLRSVMTCLKKQTALSEVGPRDHDRVIKLLAGMSTKVEVYDLQGKKIRSFYVAGQGPNYHGSYMILEDAKKPYLVEVPGFDGYLTPQFTTDLASWRSRNIFDIPADQIASVDINYVVQPLNSFHIDNTGSEPSIRFHELVAKKNPDVNLLRVKSYLKFFTGINAEGYLNGLLGMDSTIAHSKLGCKINIEQKSGKKSSYDIYWMDLNKRSKNDLDAFGNEDPEYRPFDIDRMYAVNLIDKDTLLIQMRTFEKIFQSALVFISNPDTSRRQ